MVLPQIVSSFDDDSKTEAKELFSLLTDEIVFLDPLEAELAKLFCNIWRYIEFSISNQFYQLAVENNVDFYRIFDALVFNYPRAANIKPAGFTAGPCLYKDTAHLVAYTGNSFNLGNAAMLINEGLPSFIVRKLRDKFALREKTVAILGMGYKANIDDKRDSLAYKLKTKLEVECGRVLCSDVYIREDGFVAPGQAVSAADIIILGAPHDEYRSLQIPPGKVLVDVWNFFKKGGLF